MLRLNFTSLLSIWLTAKMYIYTTILVFGINPRQC